jgi:hypothetical protein
MRKSAIQTYKQPSNVVSDKHKQEGKMNDLFKIQRPDLLSSSYTHAQETKINN